ncbi:NAD(P)H-hydrate dehydratase [Albirhodobacter sp. R86504]|uniref:NAD(P)H-hydrate dehydratase n=1 Tax=Albirhodobacter sp. R86504 TaxID=3093848 RepID=UPI003671BFA3
MESRDDGYALSGAGSLASIPEDWIAPPLVTMTPELRARLDKGASQASAHKYDHGHALVLAGGLGAGGAARLGARAALRIGAGLVSLLCPQAALSENTAQLTGVMVRVLPDSFSLRGMLQDKRLNAILLGPGLGLARAREMVPAALFNPRATVLDADALSAFEGDPTLLFGQLHEGCVLTPHRGEFRRLFPDLAAQLDGASGEGEADGEIARVHGDAVQAAASRAGCTVLLKGQKTVIASPRRDAVSLHSATGARSAPWLATAGAGDVLAGLIVGLMARGFEPHDAAAAGAWLHVEAALSFGPGLIAEDLPDQIPAVLRGVLAAP